MAEPSARGRAGGGEPGAAEPVLAEAGPSLVDRTGLSYEPRDELRAQARQEPDGGGGPDGTEGMDGTDGPEDPPPPPFRSQRRRRRRGRRALAS
ncbi:hypothetical protein GTW66_33835 [Streptomyces sp. SID5473]|uniref:hypothetical protein n=1 Tax=Streptomyces sp. SID5473 TaxID=2690299 RepID=UPI00025CDC43|nr:hypothetical protein [Streptomyces sp. SID5473]EIF89116.1 hypothetical protein [Streptomyces tsukubensis NRRL18488]MYS68780.1 hypothetical protein [Streptomyces sp. SID5473]